MIVNVGSDIGPITAAKFRRTRMCQNQRFTHGATGDFGDLGLPKVSSMTGLEQSASKRIGRACRRMIQAQGTCTAACAVISGKSDRAGPDSGQVMSGRHATASEMYVYRPE